jgi:sugar/nucleoside kinase (ribokinase family)
VHVIDAVKGVTVVDTTGAGDAYAAGFLYGYTQGHDLAACGRLGGAMAAHVISHYGGRPRGDMKALAATVV